MHIYALLYFQRSLRITSTAAANLELILFGGAGLLLWSWIILHANDSSS